MQPNDKNIERLIKQLDCKAAPASREKIREKVFEAARIRQKILADMHLAADRSGRRAYRTAGVAVAAVLVLAFLAGLHFYHQRKLASYQENIARIRQLHEEGDIPALVDVLTGARRAERKVLIREWMNQIAREHSSRGDAAINPADSPAVVMEYLRQLLGEEAPSSPNAVENSPQTPR